MVKLWSVFSNSANIYISLVCFFVDASRTRRATGELARVSRFIMTLALYWLSIL